MSEATFYDLLAKNLKHRGNHPIIVDGSVEVTYADLNDRAEQFSSWLLEQGVERGDRVGIHLHKCIEEIVAMFAVARIGAVFVNINYQWSSHQIDFVLRDCTIKVLVCGPRTAMQLTQKEWPDFLQAVVVKGKTPAHHRIEDWTQACGSKQLPPPVGIDVDLAALLYTSGSTGQPKGVMLSHLNILAGARSVTTYLNNNQNDRLLSLLPFSFDYGLSQLTTMCLIGGTIVLQKVMMPVEIANALSSHQITGFAAVPPVWIPLVKTLQDVPCDFPSLRYITNSGGKIPGNVLERLPVVFHGTEIVLMYGLTEAFRSTYLPPQFYEHKMGSMGKDIPNVETFIIDKEGVVAPGGHGELVHRGSLVSLGYWGKPEATQDKIRPCPQLRDLIGDECVCYSGDIVRIDKDGFYWFVSRSDSLMKCSGFRVSPTEVEDLVSESGLVEHVVAFAVQHELNGQEVHIAVNLYDRSDSLSEELMDFCRKSMPHYMVPGRIHVWKQDMPLTGSGKLNRPEIINSCTVDVTKSSLTQPPTKRS